MNRTLSPIVSIKTSNMDRTQYLTRGNYIALNKISLIYCDRTFGETPFPEVACPRPAEILYDLSVCIPSALTNNY